LSTRNFQQGEEFAAANPARKRIMTEIAETSVYTIAHTDALDAAYKAGGIVSFHEGRRWATARRILVAAREAGLRVPVVFAAAEYTADLIYFGWLEDVVLGAAGADRATTFRVSGLELLPKPRPKKTSLVVEKTGKPIPASHIRPYVLCRTPEFLRFLRPPDFKEVNPEHLVSFSWGYWGWGSATAELIRAVDAAEASRGFEPPIFVDIRIRRSVRAKGFTGDAFEKAVGSDRSQWIQDLGNESVLAGGGPTRIKDPHAAARLLDLALKAAERRQRLLFFCACEFPISAGAQCHRVDVADLVLAEARRRRIALVVEEWPGGEPADIALTLDEVEFRRVMRGAKSIRIGGQLPLGAAASVAWGSPLKLNGGDHEPLLTGRVEWSSRGWALRVFHTAESTEVFRKEFGFLPRKSGGRR
jgi:hypothetical protein